MHEVLKGPKEKLGKAYIGISYTASTIKTFQLIAKLNFQGILKIYRKNANEPKSEPRIAKDFFIHLGTVELYPHMEHLFKDFHTDNDRTALFETDLKGYFRSDIPIGFTREIKDTPLGKKVEVEIMRRALKKVAPAKLEPPVKTKAKMEPVSDNSMSRSARNSSRSNEELITKNSLSLNRLDRNSSFKTNEKLRISMDSSSKVEYLAGGSTKTNEKPRPSTDSSSKVDSGQAPPGIGASTVNPLSKLSTSSYMTAVKLHGHEAVDNTSPASVKPKDKSVQRIKRNRRLSPDTDNSINEEENEHQIKKPRKGIKNSPHAEKATLSLAVSAIAINDAYFETPDILVIDGEEFRRGDKDSQYYHGYVRRVTPGELDRHTDGSFYSRVLYATTVRGNRADPKTMKVDIGGKKSSMSSTASEARESCE